MNDQKQLPNTGIDPMLLAFEASVLPRFSDERDRPYST